MVWLSLCVMKSCDNSSLAGCQLEAFFFKFTRVLLSLYFWPQYDSNPNERRSEYSACVVFLFTRAANPYFPWLLWIYTGVVGLVSTWFLVIVKPLHCLIALPLWYDFSDLIVKLKLIDWLIEIDFAVHCGESLVVNKMDARSSVAASWHCTKIKCLRFLQFCAVRSFRVCASTIGSRFPLTTRNFFLVLHPSAPNSWMCTSLTTASNKIQAFHFSVFRKSRKWFGGVCVLQPATRGQSKYSSFTSVYLFHLI